MAKDPCIGVCKIDKKSGFWPRLPPEQEGDQDMEEAVEEGAPRRARGLARP
jgi:hypothetical protein